MSGLPRTAAQIRSSLARYDMSRRMVELIWRRDAAIEYLQSNPPDVTRALRVLQNEPDAGYPGGPARTPGQAIRTRSWGKVVRTLANEDAKARAAAVRAERFRAARRAKLDEK